MGKRKSSAPVKAKARPTLSTKFDCLFCNHEGSVTVKIDKKDGIGHLKCSQCPKKYMTKLGELDAGVDIYFRWVDACEAANNASADAFSSSHLPDRDRSPIPQTRSRPGLSKVVKMTRSSQPKKRISKGASAGGAAGASSTAAASRSAARDEEDYEDDLASDHEHGGYSSGSLPDVDEIQGGRRGMDSVSPSPPPTQQRRRLRRDRGGDEDEDEDEDEADGKDYNLRHHHSSTRTGRRAMVDEEDSEDDAK